MKKKILSVLLALACLWAMTVPVLAASGGTVTYHDIDGVVDVDTEGVAAISDDVDVMEPGFKFKYLRSMSSGIVESGGKAIGTGTVLACPEYETKLTITLQKSADGKSWSKVTSWSTDFITGKERIVLEKGYYMTRGYGYRLVTKVQVIANGYLETAEGTSDAIYY